MQTAAAQLDYNLPQTCSCHILSHFTSMLAPVTACIKFKVLVLAYMAINGIPSINLSTINPGKTFPFRKPEVNGSPSPCMVASPRQDGSLYWRHSGGEKTSQICQDNRIISVNVD